MAQPSSRPLRVAIDAVDGAGTTTLADARVPLLAQRSVIRASIDASTGRAPNASPAARSPQQASIRFVDHARLIALLLEPLALPSHASLRFGQGAPMATRPQV